ncbi:MAG: hypothetical protein QM808_01235 [Steroidobacteraceae bacterium]
MWSWLDKLLIALVVLCSAVYALYSLSPVAVKRKLLSLVVRVFGLRVYSWLSPRVGGCDNCGGGADLRNKALLQKLKQATPGSNKNNQ